MNSGRKFPRMRKAQANTLQQTDRGTNVLQLQNASSSWGSTSAAGHGTVRAHRDDSSQDFCKKKETRV